MLHAVRSSNIARKSGCCISSSACSQTVSYSSVAQPHISTGSLSWSKSGRWHDHQPDLNAPWIMDNHEVISLLIDRDVICDQPYLHHQQSVLIGVRNLER